MQGFLVLLAVALVASACGFKRYVWFISIGYGAAVAAIGVALLAMFGARADVASALQALLLVVYGCRLSGYLAYRELRSRSYNQKMKGEVKGNDSVTLGVRFAIWGSAALLYACQTSPVLFRMAAGGRTDAFLVVGLASPSSASRSRPRPISRRTRPSAGTRAASWTPGSSASCAAPTTWARCCSGPAPSSVA